MFKHCACLLLLLFSLPTYGSSLDWSRFKSFSIEGVSIGMTPDEANKAILARGYTLRSAKEFARNTTFFYQKTVNGKRHSIRLVVDKQELDRYISQLVVKLPNTGGTDFMLREGNRVIQALEIPDDMCARRNKLLICKVFKGESHKNKLSFRFKISIKEQQYTLKNQYNAVLYKAYLKEGQQKKIEEIEERQTVKVATPQPAPRKAETAEDFFQKALRFDLGQGVAKNHAEAVKWYKKAAELGLAAAQYNLAVKYAKGEGVEEDQQKAAAWLKKAATRNDIDAQLSLALRYINGNGVEQSDAEAMKWFRKAAEQGNPVAQYNLAFMYEYGLGVPEDREAAIKWYEKASSKGHQKAAEGLQRLQK